jgi:hypothetical protein
VTGHQDRHSHQDVVANVNQDGVDRVVLKTLIISVVMEEVVENTEIVFVKKTITIILQDLLKEEVGTDMVIGTMTMMIGLHGMMMMMTTTMMITITITKKRKTVTVHATKVGQENVVETLSPATVF